MKNLTKTVLLLSVIYLSSLYQINAQGLVDGFFNKKGDANISLSYSNSEFDSFYVGKPKVDGVPAHNEISQNIFNLYANYGISDRLTAIVSLPYITAEGNGENDPVNGQTDQDDVQDLSIVAKYKVYENQLDHGSMTYFTALGGSIPLGYEPNGILSVGSGAPTIDAKLGMHFTGHSGLFGTLAIGYTVKGEADNNFNVGDSSDFDVPNSFNTLLKIGYACKVLYVDAWFDSLSSDDKGFDIAGEGFVGNFPETRVNYARVGGNVYVPITKALGLTAGVGTTVDGRNLGNSTTYTGGIVYSLKKK